MIAYHLEGKVGVQSHAGSKTDWPGRKKSEIKLIVQNTASDSHVGKKTHAERGECRDGCRGGDDVAIDLLHTEQILDVGVAKIRAVSWTDAGTARLSGNVGVDGDNVGHGEEGGNACSQLGEEVRAFALTRLRRATSECQQRVRSKKG